MEPKFKVHIGIERPVAEVFDAVYNPKKLSGYFTTGGASAPLDEGTTVTWAFADAPSEAGTGFPVVVKKVVPEESITLEWEGEDGGHTTVQVTFKELEGGSTLVSIEESGFSDTDQGFRNSYGNCMGWSQMISALKAFVEYGINLRKGAYPPALMEAIKKPASA